jgi:uracil-DNA glycosylase family 4
LPDIDMDFEDVKRDRVRKHLEDCYGEYNVAGLSTFATLKGRGSLRDVARVFDISAIDTDRAAKSIVVRSGGDFRSSFTIEDACATFEDAMSYKQKYPEVVELAIDLEGQVKGSGQHAAAMCVSSEDLRSGERCHLATRKGVVVANWDKHDAEHMGIMKLDVLGLTALSILNHTKRLVKENYGIDIEFDKLPLTDKEVFAEINEGHNVGAFQIGSLGLMKLCKEMGVSEFNDIVIASALFRPGTLRSGMVTEYVLRKTGDSPIKHAHPLLEPITKETLGIILYQEQVMWFMYNLGGLPWKTCDTVRKVISKAQGEEQFQKFKELFIEGCKERKTLSEEEAGDVWDQLSSFGAYGFNKAHAVEYSLITYWDQWCKVHYPKEFLCASLTHTDDKNKPELVDEARRLGLTLELPKVGSSKASEWVPSKDPSDKRIYIPFQEVRGIGEVFAQQLEASDISPSELVKEVRPGFFIPKDSKRKPNSKVIDLLDKIGAFEPNRSYSEEELQEMSQYFNFSLSRDKMGKYAKLHRRMADAGIISRIEDIDYQSPSSKCDYYFGQMTEVKFGYRKAVEKGAGLARVAGAGKGSDFFDSLGGVYGNLKDQTDYAMLVFETKTYRAKKFAIEHCAGEWLLTHANHPGRNANLFAINAWIGQELLNCELEGFGGQLITRNRTRPPDPSSCSSCQLREECRRPIRPSPGKYNIAIVGEAPGKDEDKEGIGFVGRAGNDVLWPELSKHGLSRTLFHTTNVVKCFPSVTRTPKGKHITECSRWLEEELAVLKPIMILAFGNTSLKFFTGRETGIMDLCENSPTEWSDKYGCWINWCLHPASVLYQSSNKELFQKGIDNFVTKLKYIGGADLK